MSFLQNGVCYATYNEAMSAKVGIDPVLVTVGNNGDKLHFFEFDSLSQAWVWTEYTTAGGSWSLAYKSPAAVIGFPDCVMAGTVFDPILAGQIWMFALTMILGAFLVAKNAGLILEAIKRW